MLLWDQHGPERKAHIKRSPELSFWNQVGILSELGFNRHWKHLVSQIRWERLHSQEPGETWVWERLLSGLFSLLRGFLFLEEGLRSELSEFSRRGDWVREILLCYFGNFTGWWFVVLCDPWDPHWSEHGLKLRD